MTSRMMARNLFTGMWITLLTTLMLLVTVSPACAEKALTGAQTWSQEEQRTLRSLWIGSLPPLPKDPSNGFSDNKKAVEFGKDLFFDKRFSADGTVSCATCHRPEMTFTDNLALAHGLGTATRRTMPLIGLAYQSWYFWDGRKDSLWSQAVAPIENPVEHGISRTRCLQLIAEHYKKQYEETFGPLPGFPQGKCPTIGRPAPDDPAAQKAWDSIPSERRETINRVFANMGKAIAAYVRQILPTASRFDRYVEALARGDKQSMRETLTPDEVAGLRLFIGKGKCTNCHNGPLFSNGDFHNIGLPRPPGLPDDRGRAEGVNLVLADEFNCLGRYSDAGSRDCAELRFMDTSTERYVGAFKTPSLRNVADRPPYMHAGQFRTLGEVLRFYRDAKPQHGVVGAALEHGGLSDAELGQLEAFLSTLSSPLTSP